MKKSTALTILFTVTAAAALLVALSGAGTAQQAIAANTEANRAVLVELFTSEGCSSCPPADRLLVELDERQPVPGAEIITLGEHVDYWDGLGWRDRFSSAEITSRQRSYSLHFGENRVYTPQMVVDGAEEFIGSDQRQALKTIEHAAAGAKAQLRIEQEPAAGKGVVRWTVHVDSLPPKAPRNLDLYVAVSESGLSNQISRGENRGRLLKHVSVARLLNKIGQLKKGAEAYEQSVELQLDPSWQRVNLRLVAFVQEARVGRVWGVASVPVVTATIKSAQAAP